MKPNLPLQHCPHWRRGVTRPEVAVVLIVLGMLGMVVAGFISLSAERGRETTCSINVKRLVVAFQNHAADRSAYPASGRLGQELPEDWVHWQGRRRIEQSALAPWLGEISSRTMTCPKDMDTRHRSYPFSYTMNMHLHLLPGDRVDAPATTVVVFEEERPNDGACLPGHPNDRLAHRHSHGRSQAGFADGSVRLVRPDVGEPAPRQ